MGVNERTWIAEERARWKWRNHELAGRMALHVRGWQGPYKDNGVGEVDGGSRVGWPRDIAKVERWATLYLMGKGGENKDMDLASLLTGDT